jgi:RNA-directed DNA polymerase
MENASITKTTTSWQDTNWAKVQRKVFKLQNQIFKAIKAGENKKAKNLQKLLAKSYYAKLLAVRKVTQDNQGRRTPGIDGQLVKTHKQRDRLVQSLNIKEYKTKPLRRIWIPKPGKSPLTPLNKGGIKGGIGIPTIKDRATQALIKMCLEPQWEARFESQSYGFRPGRSAHDAIETIFNNIRYVPKYVLDADIAKCFDQIDHQKLLNKLDCPKTIKRTIKQWLKAGVVDKHTFTDTDSGTPQGGTISPLLANIALDGLITDITKSFPQSKTINGVRDRCYRPAIIRYADDFVIIHRDIEVINHCKILVSKWLEKIGLKLRPEKTRICHTLNNIEVEGKEEKAGFDFLGFNIKQYPIGKHSSGKNTKGNLLGFKTLIKPSSKKVIAHYRKIRDVIDKLKHAPQARLIRDLNPIIRGWANYYSTVCSKGIFAKIDHLIWWKLAAWAKRRSKKGTKKALRKYFQNGVNGAWTFQTHEGLRLIKHTETKIKRHTLIQSDRSYYDGDWVYWSERRGKHPLTPHRVSELMRRQRGKCPQCLQKFSPEELVEIDHVIPRKLGGSTNYTNLQLLHRHCHHRKTTIDRRNIKEVWASSGEDDTPFVSM